MPSLYAGMLKSATRKLRRRVGDTLSQLRGYGLGDLLTANPEFHDGEQTPRINLIMLGISPGAMFGGGTTAVRFLRAVESAFPRARIIVTAESQRDFQADRWPGWEIETSSPTGARTIAFALEPGHRLPVEPGDRFIATHWLTAYFLSSIQRAQAQQGRVSPARFVYLIQDFEPGFYPWGSRYILADSTYRRGEQTIAVFNTNLLKDYFDRNGYQFSASYAFEPRLNPTLAKRRLDVQLAQKKRLILVYGRPRTARNAFELVVAAMKLWAQRFDRASDWEVLSLGTPHKDIPLRSGVVMQSKGMLSLEDYGDRLAEAAVGLSLMVSPHPSYPPLEMAEFSVRVVTNNFANKDLSQRSPYITSLSELTPETVAEALAGLCLDFEESRSVAPSADNRGFLGGLDEFPFASQVADALKGRPAERGVDAVSPIA